MVAVTLKSYIHGLKGVAFVGPPKKSFLPFIVVADELSQLYAFLGNFPST